MPAEKAVATFGDESVELTEVWIVAKQDNKGYVVNYYAPSQTNGRNTHRYIYEQTVQSVEIKQP